MKNPLYVLGLMLLAPLAAAQACPDRNVLYWQAFPPGGESDLAARHQQGTFLSDRKSTRLNSSHRV